MNRVVRLEPPRGILRVEGLMKRYGARRVVDDVGLEVAPKEIVGLLGQNGAGKTTTFYMVIGLVRPDAGEVWIGSRRVTDEPVDVRVRAGLGYLAQEPSVFRRLTVEENLLVVLEQHGLPLDVRRQRTDRLLEEFGLEAVRRQAAWTLSGGERRRVEIARALSLEPTFLLLDHDEIHGSADHATYNEPDETTVLVGNVKIIRGSDTLTADRATVLLGRHTVIAEGGVQVVASPEGSPP